MSNVMLRRIAPFFNFYLFLTFFYHNAFKFVCITIFISLAAYSAFNVMIFRVIRARDVSMFSYKTKMGTSRT